MPDLKCVYKMCSKCIETKAVLTKTEVSNETLIFFQIVPLAFNTFIPSTFPLVEAPLKREVCDGVKLYCGISFNVLHILISWHIREIIQMCTCLYSNYINLLKVQPWYFLITFLLAKLAGAVEYIDCISARG